MPFLLRSTEYLQTGKRILASVLFSQAANLAPTLTSASSVSVTQNSLLTHTLTATDPNGDALTFTLSSAYDWVTLSGSELSITPGVLNDPGDYTVTVTVSDGEFSVDQVITIAVLAIPVQVFIPPIKRVVVWDEGITPTLVIGDVFDHKVTLQAGATSSDFDLSATESIRVAVVYYNHSQAYTSDVAITVNDPSSDLSNGLVHMLIPSSITEEIRGQIRAETFASIEIDVCIGGKNYTWFAPVRIVEGFVR